MIKKGYYAKLGIERSPTLNSSYKFYPPKNAIQKNDENSLNEI